MRGAGITATLDDNALIVHERDAHRAIQLLNASEPPALPATPHVQCPECGSFETFTVPPWSSVYLAVLAGAAFFARWQNSKTVAAVALLLMLCWPFFLRLLRTSGKQKCRRCGWLFSVD